MSAPKFEPFIPDGVAMREFTLRAVLTGTILGMIFGASSLYLVLKVGITVSAFTSVSADPPLVLICVNRKSAAVEPITVNAQFCVNLLGEAHQPLANIFASRDASAKTAALEAQNWAPGLTGLLLVPDAPAAFECTLQETVDAGTHRIFIGRVVKAHHSQTPTLAYSRRTYSRLAPL